MFYRLYLIMYKLFQQTCIRQYKPLLTIVFIQYIQNRVPSIRGRTSGQSLQGGDKMGEKGEKQISSVEIINKSGVSRATLNNYIKMGILPHPLVKRPEDSTISKANQIGYFPHSVLDTLDRVSQYKKEGRRMLEISRLLAETAIGPSEGVQYNEPPNDTGMTFFQKPVSDYGNESEELFPFYETHAGVVASDPVTKRDIRVQLKQGSLNLFHFSVLVAEIQNTTKMCAELPPDEYIGLMRQIWKLMTFLFKKYFGVYGRHPGNGIVFYFLKDRGSSYLMDAVVCALELRETIKMMNQKRKTNKEYFDELYLNIGISEGLEFIGSIPAAPAIEYISLGDAFNTARRLSDLAHSGSVWTTKNLLNLLDEKNRRKIRYGIYRREQNRDVLIENIFSRVMDLVPQDDPKFSNYMDIWTLPVTEIQNLR